jgi:DNA-binding NarL/FixJ family response regulator
MPNRSAEQHLGVQVEETAMKVFIADDSSIIRERLVSLLAGIPEIEIVGQAHNTRLANNLIRQSQPDVLILDIQMPGGSGIELLQQVKKKTPSPLVMMMTGNAFPQYRRRCLQAGADYFFDKTTEFEQIRETLCGLIPRFNSSANLLK